MADRATGMSILALAAITGLFVFADFLPSVNSIKEPEAPAMKMSKIMGPSLRFLYCYSWGYRKVFEQYATMLHDRYPGISILGDNYPPPTWRQYVAHILGLTKILLVLCVVGNVNLFSMFGQPTPSFWTWLSGNKLYGCLMIFFLSNAIEGQLISTGAFEIQFNDMPVWSKLETGRIPQPPELYQIIDNHIRLDQSPSWSEAI